MHRPYLDVLANLFYPQRCVGCSRRASDVLCRSCVEALPLVGSPLCGRCGAPTAFEVYGCDGCREREFGFDSARVPLRYEGVGRELVRALKHDGYARVVERVMAPLMAASLDGDRFDLVVPVPLHRSRLRRRGFNQAGLMARGVAGRIGVPVSDKLRPCVGPGIRSSSRATPGGRTSPAPTRRTGPSSAASSSWTTSSPQGLP